MEIAALVILTVFSLVGFAAIFFTTFGTLIILIGAVIYAGMTGFSVLGLEALLVLFTLYLVGEVMEYVFVIAGAKKLGASNAAAAGAIIGGILGAVLGAAFLGIGLLLGTFLGIFLGAFLVELILEKDLVKSLKSGAGSLLGRVGSIIVKVGIAIVMLLVMLRRIV